MTDHFRRAKELLRLSQLKTDQASPQWAQTYATQAQAHALLGFAELYREVNRPLVFEMEPTTVTYTGPHTHYLVPRTGNNTLCYAKREGDSSTAIWDDVTCPKCLKIRPFNHRPKHPDEGEYRSDWGTGQD